MITTNVYKRTFHIKCGGSIATAFSLDVDQRFYLITASHCIPTRNAKRVEIHKDGRWHDLDVTEVGRIDGDHDICVLAPDKFISPEFNLPASSHGIGLSQNVYFLGFPYGFRTDDKGNTNDGFPLPFIKGGLLSSIRPEGGCQAIYVDGHNNAGFSGGPLVFTENGTRPTTANPFRVAGVVTSYPAIREPVFDQAGNDTGYHIRNNPGIVRATAIKHVIELIEKNPVGLARP